MSDRTADADDRRVRMHIEVEIGEDPVRGRIGTAGAERDFVGWTELASAIEECAHPARPSEAAQ